MATGTIIKFLDEKGFGFIKPDEGEEEIFFHHTAFEGEPREGMNVEYEEEASDRGPRAGSVRAV